MHMCIYMYANATAIVLGDLGDLRRSVIDYYAIHDAMHCVMLYAMAAFLTTAKLPEPSCSGATVYFALRSVLLKKPEERKRDRERTWEG